jgi:DNA-directed RNA polymerase subunit E"
MVKKKACKECRTLTESNTCPECKSTDLTTTWKGKILIIDPEKSEIAKMINLKKKGEYVLKVR